MEGICVNRVNRPLHGSPWRRLDAPAERAGTSALHLVRQPDVWNADGGVDGHDPEPDTAESPPPPRPTTPLTPTAHLHRVGDTRLRRVHLPAVTDDL